MERIENMLENLFIGKYKILNIHLLEAAESCEKVWVCFEKMLVGLRQTWKMSKCLYEVSFSIPNFTPKCASYAKIIFDKTA